MDLKQTCSILEAFGSEKYFFTEYNSKIISAKDIEDFLKIVDDEFDPKLSDMHNLFEYAEKVIKLSDAIFAVSKDSNKLYGMNVFYLRNRISEYCHRPFIAVSRELRGEGLAQKLTESMIRLCKVEKVSGILSQTWAKNDVSLKLHLSNGFEVYGKEKRNGSDDYTIKLIYKF